MMIMMDLQVKFYTYNVTYICAINAKFYRNPSFPKKIVYFSKCCHRSAL